jgi:hypothetical protein
VFCDKFTISVDKKVERNEGLIIFGNLQDGKRNFNVANKSRI